MTCDEFLTYFEDVTGRNGHYLVRCPTHDDKNPSLSITEVEDRILIHCFAGCKAIDILQSLGLGFDDINKKERRNKMKKNFKQYETNDKNEEMSLKILKEINILDEKEEEEIYELVCPVVEKIEREEVYDEKTLAIYPYIDEKGRSLFEIEKRRGGGQPYYVRYKVGDEYVYKLPLETKIPIYNLLEVTQAIKEEKPIWIVEGESKVEALRKLDIVATTVPFKSPRKWKHDSYNSYLEGVKDIIVLVDNDSNAEEFAENTITELMFLDESVNISKVRISDMCATIKDGGDIDDLIEVFGVERVKATLKTIEDSI